MPTEPMTELKTQFESPYFAAIDLGSNSFHMLIVRLNEDQIDIIDREKDMVQIARGLQKDGSLSAEAKERAIASLTRFAERLRDIPSAQIRAVGTKALRAARDTKEFLKQAEAALGVPIQIISGYAFMGLNANILVQEYIKEAGGADIRCFVVGNKVVAAMKRQGAEGEFRSNLHRGGSATLVRLSKEERATAVNAAKVMGLNVCGVDILQSNNGPVVMEVNSSPGLEGIENATNKDVAALVMEFIEANAKPNNTKTRGKG